ncbi:MAG: DUF2288 domain-containing protein [Deltaproteobacteria bacterium]|nr:DUF2288 domain-containing protein [Deltaproteobacteria bacterium]
MSEIAESFRQDLAEVPWKDLRIHLQRDAIVIVAAELDLVTTAVAVAEDDKTAVEKWLAAGHLLKPTAEQLTDWEMELEKPFCMLIVQPFILLQPVTHD